MSHVIFRNCGLAIAAAVVLVSGAVGQEKEKSRPWDVIRPLECFVGNWSGDFKPNIGPEGTVYGKCELAALNTLLRVQWSFKPKVAKLEPASILDVAIGLNGATNELEFWAHTLEGHMQGKASFDGKTLSLHGHGFDFNGVEQSRLITYTIEGKELVIEQTEIVRGGKKAPDEPVMRLVRGESVDETADPLEDHGADHLVKEIQGTWELAQSGGRRTVKTLEGNKTILTRYDKDGNIASAHISECELSERNGVKIHTVTSSVITEGPRKGLVVPAPFLGRGYIYTIEGDTWVEARGLMTSPDGKARLYRWKRVKASTD